MDNKKQCLIITATVVPNSNFVVNTDSEKRRKEYLDVLKYYSSIFLGDIYFAENSGFNFLEDIEFSNLFQKENIYCLSLAPSNEFDKGKGYQEFQVLDEVVAKINKSYDAFIKVSGRYLTTNFNQLIKQENQGLIIDRHQVKKVAITAFFRCRISFYQEHFRSCYKEVNDSKGVFIEHVIYKILKKVDPEKINIFNVTPLYKGVSGSYGGSLNRHRIKTFLINIERKILKLNGENELKNEFK